jgi:hypothetical protein
MASTSHEPKLTVPIELQRLSECKPHVEDCAIPVMLYELNETVW